MAVTVGAETNTEFFQGSSTATISLAVSGSNRLLLAYAACPAARSITDVSYNGVSMTSMQTAYTLGGTVKNYIFKLVSPSTGTNNIVITYDSNPASTCTLHAISFSNVTLGADSLVSTLTTNPSDTLVTSATGIVWNQSLCSFYGGSPFVKVDSVASTNTSISTGANTYHSAGWYSASVSAGSKSITSSFTNQGTLHSVELQQNDATTSLNRCIWVR
jgi:hypothetical protein